MNKIFLLNQAQSLRLKGASLNEITKRLKIPKSTVQFWCRNIILTKKQLKHLADNQRMGGMMAAEKLRQKRILATKQLMAAGIKEIGNLSFREIFLIGSALYWAEGYRKGNDEFGFTNSDPKMIKFMIYWLEKSCKIPKNRIHLRVCINQIHEDRINSIQKFWSKITKIPPNQFTNPTFIKIKNKKIYQNREEYFGALRIKISKGTDFRRKLLGWIEGISQNRKNEAKK